MGPRLWRLDGKTIDLAAQGLIMGVLNVTPDSFSDGGRFFDATHAVAQGVRMASEGAAIIDVGGESTRPHASPVSAEDEAARVLPVIEQLVQGTTALISVDTSKASVAAAALDRGAHVINDVTGGGRDPGMLPLAAERRAAIILMHMQGSPRTMQDAPHYDDVVGEVAEFFRQKYALALQCGIDPMAIAFDPGIGFGKTLDHNLELLGNLNRLRVVDRPLVVGVSRKSFLGKLIKSEQIADRVAPTVGLTAFLRERGADILRVHDVKPNADALRVSEAISRRTR